MVLFNKSRWAYFWISLLLLALGGTGCWAMKQLSPGLHSHYVRQVAALPLISYWTFIVGRRFSMPRGLYLAPLLAAAFVFTGFTYYREREANVLLQRLKGDDLGALTRRFYSRISGPLQKEAFALTQLPWQVPDWRSAAELFNSDEKAVAVLGGTGSHSTLYFPPPSVVLLEDVVSTALPPEVGKLRLIEGIRELTVPLDSVGAGMSFLTDLLRGLPQRHSGEITPTKATDLHSAAERVALWNTYAHRSFPYLLLGNFYFKQALRVGRADGGDADCAKDSLVKALGLLFFRDNPDLHAAVTNNLAVFLGFQGAVKGKKKLLKQASEMLRSPLPPGSRKGAATLLTKQTRSVFRTNYRILRTIRLGRQKFKGKVHGSNSRSSSGSTRIRSGG